MELVPDEEIVRPTVIIVAVTEDDFVEYNEFSVEVIVPDSVVRAVITVGDTEIVGV